MVANYNKPSGILSIIPQGIHGWKHPSLAHGRSLLLQTSKHIANSFFNRS